MDKKPLHNLRVGDEAIHFGGLASMHGRRFVTKKWNIVEEMANDSVNPLTRSSYEQES